MKTSMFMPGGFVFPPSQHENLPLEPEMLSESENEDSDEVEVFDSDLVVDEGTRSELRDQRKININGYYFPIFDEKGNLLSVDETEFAEHVAVPGSSSVDVEDTFNRSAQLKSFQRESCTSALAESSGIDEVTESYCQDSYSSSADFPNPTDKDKIARNLPCRAWWNRRVASFYSLSREANGLWSIYIASAVLGLVILGQHWHQERWQLLQLKWHACLYDEKTGWILGPFARLKDMVFGSQSRGSLLKSRTASDH